MVQLSPKLLCPKFQLNKMNLYYYYVFHGRVTLFFANNFLTQRRITMKFLHNFFSDPEVIFISHTMFTNTPTKEFTLKRGLH